MKTLTLLLLLFSATAFAQTPAAKPAPAAAPKPSTTDCPTWGTNPNQSKSKAAYYESLRHKKATQKPKMKATPTPKFNSSSDKILETKKKE